jgi:hypothetical protein
VQVPVNITGVQGTLKAMRKFDPDLAKQMNTQIRGAMLPIRDKARAFAPGNSEMLSGWTTANTSTAARGHRFFPKYDQSETRAGIVYRQGANNKGEIAGAKFRRRWQVAYFVANNSPGGAIFETSGRVNPNGRPASRIVSSRHKLESERKYRVSSGTTNDMNSLKGKIKKLIVWPRLSTRSDGTDTSAYWFMADSSKVGESLKAKFAERPSIDAPSEVYENKNWEWTCDFFYALGIGHPAYIYGSTGVN